SIKRQLLPLISYSLAPSRNIRRVMDTSEYSMGSALSELSMVTVTSARPSGALDEVPAKMTSSILPPRSVLAPCSPMTQARASTTLDLPEPFGPTTQVTPVSKAKVVGCAKDLNPLRVRLLRYNGPPFFSRAECLRLRYRSAGAAHRRNAGRARPRRGSGPAVFVTQAECAAWLAHPRHLGARIAYRVILPELRKEASAMASAHRRTGAEGVQPIGAGAGSAGRSASRGS